MNDKFPIGEYNNDKIKKKRLYAILVKEKIIPILISTENLTMLYYVIETISEIFDKKEMQKIFNKAENDFEKLIKKQSLNMKEKIGYKVFKILKEKYNKN
jgi:hypothetical protein